MKGKIVIRKSLSTGTLKNDGKIYIEFILQSCNFSYSVPMATVSGV